MVLSDNSESDNLRNLLPHDRGDLRKERQQRRCRQQLFNQVDVLGRSIGWVHAQRLHARTKAKVQVVLVALDRALELRLVQEYNLDRSNCANRGMAGSAGGVERMSSERVSGVQLGHDGSNLVDQRSI